MTNKMPREIWAYEVNVDKDYGAYCTRDHGDRSTKYIRADKVQGLVEALAFYTGCGHDYAKETLAEWRKENE